MAQFNQITHTLQEVVSYFTIQRAMATAQPYGSRHINDTYRIVNTDPACPDYHLQRINHQVFRNIPALTENIQLVTMHLRHKLVTLPGANPNKEVLTLVPAKSVLGYYQDENGNYWRLLLFLGFNSQ